ncbi:unnamed protein product [Linum tenue]|uniref:Uncharacterized protein n=1 Tax=Linum tenue TaxID=586396 RepID=A0AAV0J606_9ROSI|nr:unnamed protein product [Linum tenue]
MKALFLPFLCLLATAFCFYSRSFGSPSTVLPHPSMRSMRDWNMPTSPTKLSAYDSNKDLEEDKQKNIKAQEEQVKNLNSSDHVDELIYHIDYNGVTTHPTPRDRP